jgi:hypothetical protein
LCSFMALDHRPWPLGILKHFFSRHLVNHVYEKGSHIFFIYHRKVAKERLESRLGPWMSFMLHNVIFYYAWQANRLAQQGIDSWLACHALISKLWWALLIRVASWLVPPTWMFVLGISCPPHIGNPMTY